MAFPDGFDLDALLAPIPGDAPQGVDLREDFSAQSPYQKMRDARSNARDAERLAESPDPDSPSAPDPAPMWRDLRVLGLKVLSESSKDLEVAAWLTEAYVRSHGLAGLAAGAALIKGLAEQYWDDVFPLPDDYGMETRVAPITGLNGRDGAGSLRQPLYQVVLFNRMDGSPVMFHTYRGSAQLPALDDARRKQRIEAGAIPFDQIENEAKSVGGVRSLAGVRDAANEALASWEAMAALLDEKAGADAPSTSHVRDMVREILEICLRYAPAEPGAEIPGQDGDGAMVAGADGVVVAGAQAGPGGFAMPVAQGASREDALRALETIATYFRKSEPNSPLSYTLAEEVRRARMSWPDLLEELIVDRDSRNAVLSSLGIRPPPPEE